MDHTTIIVKVGKKSVSRFRNAVTYRAITIKELDSLINKINPNIIVIENIKENEYNKAVEILSSYKSDDSHKLYFLTPDNDEVTTGLADELCAQICLDLETIYNRVKEDTGVSLDPSISVSEEIKETLEENIEDNFVNDLEGLIGLSSDNIEEIKPIETETIRNRLEADIDEVSDFELGIGKSVVEEIEAHVILDKQETVEDVEVNIENNEENIDTQKTSEYNELLRDENNNLKIQIDDYEEKLSNLEAKYNKVIGENDNLNKLVKAIEDERDNIKSELITFETSDIISDPDTISEFEAIKQELEEMKNRALEQSTLTTSEVEELTNAKNALEERVEELRSINVDLDDKVNRLEMDKLTLENDLREARDTTAMDVEIQELKSIISEVNGELEQHKLTIDQLNEDIENKNSEIYKLNDFIELSKKYEEHLRDLLSIGAYKVADAFYINNQLVEVTNERDRLLEEVNELSASLTDSQNNLERITADVEKRVALAKQFASEDLSRLTSENAGLSAQVAILQGQLSTKESQYNAIIAATGMTESGAMSVMETNKTLEAMNAQLREQIADDKIRISNLEKDKTDKEVSISNLQNEKQKLSTQIKAMSSGFSGGVGVSLLPQIMYNARGLILPVVGSGSYGITTTAYSLALACLKRGKTVILDFDMITSKVDQWVKKSPIIDGIPGIVPCSALDAAIENGAAFMLSNADRYIQGITRTNRGSILDYVGGITNKHDIVKLVSCDYSNILNFLGTNYDYIIIDMGRIGSSDINNQLIKVISDVARTTIMVTLNDPFDTRNTRMQIERVKLNMNNMAWLLNMSSDTKVSDLVKKRISPAEYEVMPFIEDFYNKKKDFGQVRLSKDRFDKFLDKAVFKGR